MDGGFQQSAVRLNQHVRNQARWTAAEMETRSRVLVERALEIWRHHEADAASIQAAEIRDLRARAANRDSGHLKMADYVRSLLDNMQAKVRELGEIIEVIERKSVCCYGPSFFAELMPMRNCVRVILPLELSEVEYSIGLAVSDASTWRFVPNRAHTDCDLLIDVWQDGDIAAVMPMIRQAFDQSR